MRSGTAFLFALALALAAVSVAAGQPNAHNADKVSYFDDRRDYIPECEEYHFASFFFVKIAKVSLTAATGPWS